MNVSFQWDLGANQLVKIDQSMWGAYIGTYNKDHTRLMILDGYSAGDNVMYFWEKDANERKLIYGVPLEDRKTDQVVPANAIDPIHFVDR